MSSKYQLTKGTQIHVSAAAALAVDDEGIEWKDLSCTGKEISFQSGQKSDIDVATFCSEEQEMDDGLAAPSEFSLNGNWMPDDEGQQSLLAADATGERRAIRITFKSGATRSFIVTVRQYNYSGSVNGAWTGGFTMRVKGGEVAAAAPAP
ncbi:hypothetical protein GN155_017785 [Alcanivorax sp. ZXX171]|nr:hypothetical protein [Alcanivorax sp. ZXX171]